MTGRTKLLHQTAVAALKWGSHAVVGLPSTKLSTVTRNFFRKFIIRNNCIGVPPAIDGTAHARVSS